VRGSGDFQVTYEAQKADDSATEGKLGD